MGRKGKKTHGEFFHLSLVFVFALLDVASLLQEGGEDSNLSSSCCPRASEVVTERRSPNRACLLDFCNGKGKRKKSLRLGKNDKKGGRKKEKELCLLSELEIVTVTSNVS